MNESAEKALIYLAGNTDIKEVTIEDLQKLVAESPFFPVGQFLLSKKLKDENKPQYSSQLQKTSLYFSNAYWLQYQLTEVAIEEELPEPEPAEKEFEEKHDDSALTNVTIFEEQDNKFNASPDESLVPNNNTAEAFKQTNETRTIETSSRSENADTEVASQQNSNEQEDSGNVSLAEEEVSVITKNINEETENLITDLGPDTTTPEAENTSTVAEVPPAAELEVVALEEEMAGVAHEVDIPTKNFIEEVEHQTEDNDEAVQDEHDKMFQNIKAMLDASSEEADADTKDVVVPMDPYYTIDYFASQGIKLELEKNPQDQLGQNLKKFTQWLRHMKKLGPEDATEAINRTETEADIQKIADTSNTVREVVTEAMASVLEKQGKNEKAIELYNKLSFLNPDKNAYFADKIKKLKGI